MKRAVAVFALAGLASAASAQLSAVNNIAGTWIDIAQAANDTGLHADDQSVAFNASFGNAVLAAGTINISSNGTACNPAVNSFGNSALPVAGTAGYYPYWDDLYNVTIGNIYAANLGDRTVIEWFNVQQFPGVNNATFELQIFNGGTGPGGALAQFLYQSISGFGNGASATIGAQNATSFAQWSFNTASIQDGSVISIVPAPASLALLGLGGLVAGRRRR